jgi:flagellar motor switch protein FliM
MFTPMESRIVNMILDAAFRTLRDAWAPILALDFELVSQEINPQFAQIADENDLVILSRFETETPTQNMGFIDIVHPYVSLKPVRELLRSRLQSGDGNEESDKVWRDELESAVGGSSLDCRVVLGQIHTTFRAVETMQPGDILHFKKPELATLQPNGIPAFEVHIGTVAAQVAVQIERAIAPGGK